MLSELRRSSVPRFRVRALIFTVLSSRMYIRFQESGYLGSGFRACGGVRVQEFRVVMSSSKRSVMFGMVGSGLGA